MTKLRTIRLQRGYTLRDLSDLAGPSVPTLSRAERELQNLSPAAKVAVARALDVPVSALFAPVLVEEPAAGPVEEPSVDTLQGRHVAALAPSLSDGQTQVSA